MADRKKIIDTLEYLISGDCTETQYDYEDEIEAAIELLKEREAVKPVPPEDEFGLYRCGKCYHQLFRCVDKYCSRCGQAVEWDD